MRRERHGFTLMEMLLVSALIATVSVVIFTALNNGIKLWGRGIAIDQKSVLFIGLERMASDLRGTLPFSLIKFKGTGSTVSFATVVLTGADQRSSRADEFLVDEIGAVEYRFDAGQGKLLRRQADYGQGIKKQWGPEEEIASGITDIHFDYYLDGLHRAMHKEEVDQLIPIGVMMTVRLQQGTQEIQRYFEIPVGGSNG